MMLPSSVQEVAAARSPTVLSFLMGFLLFSSLSARRRRRGDLQPCYTRQRRSYSYPLLEPGSFQEAKRRLSHVTRRLSCTIGWPSAGVPTADIVKQAKMMCVQYVRLRLNKGAIFCIKWGLKVDVNDEDQWSVVDEVFPVLHYLGRELERIHPTTYTGISRQACSKKVLNTEKAVHTVLKGVAQELSHSDLTWAKVVSLFAVAGGLAEDCVRQRHPEFLQSLVQSMGEALDDHMVTWIAHQGGWMGLYFAYRRSSFIKRDQLFAVAMTSFVLFAVVTIIFLWLQHVL